jgi:adenylate kinase family enzyme
MSSFPFKRVVIIGVTSSGKSTLAETLAKQFNMNFIELDALHWEPGWQEAPLDVFRARVQEATRAERWAIAGNYRMVRDITWPKAEAVIWLDYPFLTVLGQLTRRTFRRWWNQELLWGTNRESLLNHLKLWSQESLFHWLFRTYWRRKREYKMLLSQPENQHLQVIRLKHPRETQLWLENLRSPANSMEQTEWTSNSGS